MTNTKVFPADIDPGSWSEWQILKKSWGVVAFADETGWGWTWTIPSFNEPADTDDWVAGETIAAWEHCAKWIYHGLNLTDKADVLKVCPSPATINYWQAFYREVAAQLTTAVWSLYQKCNYPSNSRWNYSFTAKVYALTWTYGVDAVPTWPALYTSNTLSGLVDNNFSGSIMNFTFTFNDDIPIWYYFIVIEGTTSHSSNGSSTCSILWDNTSPVYAWNCVDTGSPIANTNLAILLNSDEEVVYLSDASDPDLNDWVGVATESKTIWETITLQDQWEIDQAWAANDGAIRYLSDTPGELSLTPGTYLRIIAQWSGVDKAWIWRTQYREAINLTKNTAYFTTIGWLAEWSFTAVDSWLQNGSIVEIQISDDNVTFYPIQEVGIVYGGMWNQTRGAQAVIPPNKWFKINFTWWSVSQTVHRCRFRPIK